VARGGFFSRIRSAASAVRGFFTGDSGEQPPRATPRESRDRQRARERDPYLRIWDDYNLNRTGYLHHKELIEDMAAQYDLDRDDEEEMWDDYLRWIVGKRGEHQQYRRNDLQNPFWQKWGIDPEEQFDWHDWREAMGYPHGNRS